jgi:hypothetical protein
MQPHLSPIPAQVPGLEELIQKTKEFVAAAKSPATLKAYRNDWRDFETWSSAQSGFASLDTGNYRALHR